MNGYITTTVRRCERSSSTGSSYKISKKDLFKIVDMCEDCKLEVIIKVADELARDKEVFGSSFVKHMGKMMKQIRKYFDIKYQE